MAAYQQNHSQTASNCLRPNTCICKFRKPVI